MKHIHKNTYYRINSPDFIHRIALMEDTISQINGTQGFSIDYSSGILHVKTQNHECIANLRQQLANKGVRISKPLSKLKTLFKVDNYDQAHVQQTLSSTLEKNINVKHYRPIKNNFVMVTHSVSENHVSILRSLEKEGMNVTLVKNASASPIDRSLDLLSIGSGLAILTAFTHHLHALGNWPAEYFFAISIFLNTWIIALAGFTQALRKITLNSGGLFMLAMIAALYFGLWQQSALIGFSYAAIKTLERYFWGKTRSRIARLINEIPEYARTILCDKQLHIIDASDVDPDTSLLVKKGEIIPVDGRVTDGKGQTNSVVIYGENNNIPLSRDTQVYAGTTLIEGEITVKAEHTLEDSLYNKFVNAVKYTIKTPPPTMLRLHKIGMWFKYVLLLLTTISIGITFHPDSGFNVNWLLTSLALVVITQSSTATFAIQLGYLGSISMIAHLGVKVTNGNIWQQARHFNRILIDKTGILTADNPEAQEIIALDGSSASEILTTATAISMLSDEPQYRAICRRFSESGYAPPEAANIVKVDPLGISAEITGNSYSIGNHKFFERQGLITGEIQSRLLNWEQEGSNGYLLARNREIIGIIMINDPIRPHAGELKDFIAATGIKHSVLLSNDNPNVGNMLQDRYDFTEAKLDLAPEDKLDILEQYSSNAQNSLLISNDVELLEQWKGCHMTLDAVSRPELLNNGDFSVINSNSSHATIAIDLIKHVLSSAYSIVLLYLGTKLTLFTCLAMQLINLETVIMVELLFASIALQLATRYLKVDKLLKLPQPAIYSRDIIKLPSRPRSLMR